MARLLHIHRFTVLYPVCRLCRGLGVEDAFLRSGVHVRPSLSFFFLISGFESGFQVGMQSTPGAPGVAV